MAQQAVSNFLALQNTPFQISEQDKVSCTPALPRPEKEMDEHCIYNIWREKKKERST
jgi:hypothetical protein